MRIIYVTVINMLLFFFLVIVFGGALQISRGTLVDEIVVALFFGIFMAIIPNILKFLKLPVNAGSLMILGILVSFTFFFMGLYLFNFITITGKTISVGLSFLDPIVLPDKTFAIVILSIVAAVFSVGLELMDKKK